MKIKSTVAHTYVFVAFQWIPQLTDHRVIKSALHIVVLSVFQVNPEMCDEHNT